jgi:plastocyanin
MTITDGDAEDQAQPVPTDESNASLAAPETAAEAAHPYRERFVVPFIFPLLIVVGIVVFVLNVSRLFIASAGTGAVIIAVSMTLLILFGAAALSAAPGIRTSSLTLIVGGSLVAVTSLGWLTVGHSEPHEEEAVELGPAVGAATVNARSNLTFEPAEVEAPLDPANELTVLELSLRNEQAGAHTLAFKDPNVQWEIAEVSQADETVTHKGGFPGEGEYYYYCTISGHEAAGMHGNLIVTPDLEPQAPDEGGGEGGGGEGGGEAPAEG